jgi:hypothetical protein
MARTPKPLRRARKRDIAQGRKPCGQCMCCPCNNVGCDWCPSDGRRRGEAIPDYTRRWVRERCVDDPPNLSNRKRKAGRKWRGDRT